MSASQAIVARWTAHRSGPSCDECGTRTAGTAGSPCPGCGEIPGPSVGMVAAVIDTPAGSRLVVARREGTGWVPVRHVDATPKAVRMIRRQHQIPAAESTGGAELC